MLVVGGYNSSNTCNLARICAERVRRSIADPECLVSRSECGTGRSVHLDDGGTGGSDEGLVTAAGPLNVGLTAGASTPNNIVGHVIKQLEAFCRRQRSSRDSSGPAASLRTTFTLRPRWRARNLQGRIRAWRRPWRCLEREIAFQEFVVSRADLNGHDGFVAVVGRPAVKPARISAQGAHTVSSFRTTVFSWSGSGPVAGRVLSVQSSCHCGSACASVAYDGPAGPRWRVILT